jgi:hypothetical protein
MGRNAILALTERRSAAVSHVPPTATRKRPSTGGQEVMEKPIKNPHDLLFSCLPWDKRLSPPQAGLGGIGYLTMRQWSRVA